MYGLLKKNRHTHKKIKSTKHAINYVVKLNLKSITIVKNTIENFSKIRKSNVQNIVGLFPNMIKLNSCYYNSFLFYFIHFIPADLKSQ